MNDPHDDTTELFACEICGNTPDESGTLEHGRGCYKISSDGGGTEFVEVSVPRLLDVTTLALAGKISNSFAGETKVCEASTERSYSKDN